MVKKFMPLAGEDPMSTLCRMVAETNYEDLPHDVIYAAKRSILDAMAVIIGGSALEGVPEVVGLVKERGGKPESIIPFYGGRVPAPEAGMAIGPMARAMDCGELHEGAGHCSEFTVPVLLAAAGLRESVTGQEFITAFVTGQEVLMRIGMGWQLTQGFARGRGDGHAIFGAVAAVGKLLGLSREELENAEGIARAMTQPHDLAMYSPATLIARVQHGFICQDAINACLLAQRGITGPRREVLSGPRGYFALAGWETNPAAVTAELGEKWEIPNTIVKTYVCCGLLHAAIESLLGQMEKHGFRAEDIEGIDVSICSQGWQMCLPVAAKWHPQTVAECQFSLPYVLAAAAYDRRVFLDSYTPQAMARPEVRDLMSRITAVEDVTLPNLGARVRTVLRDGRETTAERDHIKGHPLNPLSEEELVAKFRLCAPYSAYRLSDNVVDSLISTLLKLEDVDDVAGTLILPITPK